MQFKAWCTKEIPVVFHNESNYHYHFIIKELAEGKFNCLGKNSEKCITFSVLIEKEVTKIDKKGEEITKTILYRLQLIESARLLVDDLLKEFIKLNVQTVICFVLNTQTLKMI